MAYFEHVKYATRGDLNPRVPIKEHRVSNPEAFTEPKRLSMYLPMLILLIIAFILRILYKFSGMVTLLYPAFVIILVLILMTQKPYPF